MNICVALRPKNRLNCRINYLPRLNSESPDTHSVKDKGCYIKTL